MDWVAAGVIVTVLLAVLAAITAPVLWRIKKLEDGREKDRNELRELAAEATDRAVTMAEWRGGLNEKLRNLQKKSKQ